MSILDLFYPKKCLECNKNGQYICDKCVKKAKDPSFSGLNSNKNHIFKNNISLWEYNGVIRKAILVLKYRFVFDIAKELSDVFYKRIIEKNIKFKNNSILTSVPLHKKRQLFRGFNQTEEIAKNLANKLKLRYLPDLLIRLKNTKFQTNLTKEERKENIKNAFIFNNKYKMRNKDRTIVIFDDVWTTGSTIKEMTKVLKKEGIKSVISLTITKR